MYISLFNYVLGLIFVPDLSFIQGKTIVFFPALYRYFPKGCHLYSQIHELPSKQIEIKTQKMKLGTSNFNPEILIKYFEIYCF